MKDENPRPPATRKERIRVANSQPIFELGSPYPSLSATQCGFSLRGADATFGGRPSSSLNRRPCDFFGFSGRYGAAASIIRLLASARAKARIVTQGSKGLGTFTA